MKRILLKLLFICLCAQVHGQRTCGSELNLSKLKLSDPARYQRIMDLENRTKKSMSKSAAISSSEQSTNTIIIVPVVVHIVYNNYITQNISDAQVNSQLYVLNEDYNRLNSDQTKTPISFASVAGSANIQFKLASKDPNGNNTSGITRTYTLNSASLSEAETSR
ncbi:MAG: hypothetical protein Q8904_07650 [Bacteroidota bacterium]|nr:hypothetical protein [Bacteroidota bacterium]